jgi:His-Xaa-Ser system protein HxsD
VTGKNDQECKLTIDTQIYPLEAIQAAGYTLTARAFVRIERNGGKAVSVRLKPKAGSGSADLSDEFHNELLHEALRRQVSQANQKIREYIVTKALVSAQVPSVLPPDAPAVSEEECPECAAEARSKDKKGLVKAAPESAPVDPELEKEIEKLLSEIEKSGPGTDDPLGVAVPWEKKYGGKAGGKKAKRQPAAAKPAPKRQGKKKS